MRCNGWHDSWLWCEKHINHDLTAVPRGCRDISDGDPTACMATLPDGRRVEWVTSRGWLWEFGTAIAVAWKPDQFKQGAEDGAHP